MLGPVLDRGLRPQNSATAPVLGHLSVSSYGRCPVAVRPGFLLPRRNTGHRTSCALQPAQYRCSRVLLRTPSYPPACLGRGFGIPTGGRLDPLQGGVIPIYYGEAQCGETRPWSCPRSAACRRASRRGRVLSGKRSAGGYAWQQRN